MELLKEGETLETLTREYIPFLLSENIDNAFMCVTPLTTEVSGYTLRIMRRRNPKV